MVRGVRNGYQGHRPLLPVPEGRPRRRIRRRRGRQDHRPHGGRCGLDTTRVYAGPTSVRGITGLLLLLAEGLLSTYATDHLSSFDIVSGRFRGVGTALPTTLRLLPVDSKSTREGKRPRYVGPDHFALAAVREFLYITVHEILLDALASEHGARLTTAQSPENWLDERAERVRRHLMATRREASTQEMIEIASGARARRGMS